MSKELIAAFLREMQERHRDELEAIELPEGTHEYVQERLEASDAEALTVMLKLSYLMGLHAGYAAHAAEGDAPPANPFGPLEA